MPVPNPDILHRTLRAEAMLRQLGQQRADLVASREVIRSTLQQSAADLETTDREIDELDVLIQEVESLCIVVMPTISRD